MGMRKKRVACAGGRYALDPKSLATLGLETLGDQLQPGMPFTTGLPFVDKLAAGVVGDPLTAHPKVSLEGLENLYRI